MTVVVADTSPLNYLLLIGEVAILPRLYGRVCIPSEVLAELTDSEAPPKVSEWVQHRPAWLEVREIKNAGRENLMRDLDPGERAAILLAEDEPDVLLLIDDAAGRAEASRRGIRTTGTLGVLRAASIRRLLNLPSALKRLTETNFRISRSLVADLLAEDSTRKEATDD